MVNENKAGGNVRPGLPLPSLCAKCAPIFFDAKYFWINNANKANKTRKIQTFIK